MADQLEEKPPSMGRRVLAASRRALGAVPKWFTWIVLGLVAILLILFVASFFLDEPLRKTVEQRMNAQLKGYTVRLPKLHFQLIGLSVTLKGLTVFQDANPKPPIAYFPVINTSVHWREIIYGRVVSDVRIGSPKLHINLTQLRTEAKSEVPLKERGWQRAVQEIHPLKLKINRLSIRDASITYIDQDPNRPLKLTNLNLTANNIRNIHLPDKVYPSSFQVNTDIFGTGRGVIEGKANFLAEPHPGAKAEIRFEDVPLGYFTPVIARANMSIRGGKLSTSGELEYAPNVKKAHLRHVTIDGMDADYTHTGATAEERRAEKAAKAAKKAGESEMLLKLDKLRLKNCTFGFINKNVDNPYRVFLSDTYLDLNNLSNKFSQGPAKAELRGKFMGSGATAATAHFRPEKQGPDLDLYVKIEGTRLADMNNLLRAYGNFDVVAGNFSFYSELHVKNNKVTGYLKPFFKGMKVYDRRQDREKGIFRKMYEALVGGVAKLLESRPQKKVATKADISGPVQEPGVSTWQVVVELVKNAFFKAILPGFEREVSNQRK